ncbi:MAG: hypothetical protein JWN94_4410 [Betaproteobacteria bacterium]|nr:hypothetical protein [Betaproteobacteria bacterium]
MTSKRHLRYGFAALALCFAVPAPAATIGVQSGGITLNSTNTATAGTFANPWLINENMTSPGILVFSNTPLGNANPTGSGHDEGRWFSKTVLNNTGATWTSFELELQVRLGTPSGQGDGLSFADGSNLTGLFTSNQFATYTRQDVTRDYLNFSGGDVLPGESVTFKFVITDNSDNSPFYLVQTPNVIDAVPEPETYGMLLAGLGFMGFVARRRKHEAS